MENNKIQRIAIIGNAGSGKSILAQKLGKILHLPVYHLDQYFWKPHWTQPDLAEYKEIHDALCEKEEWIIDGMNLRISEYRIFRADVIIFLDLPLYLCFWRIFKRMWKYYGKETPSSAAQCPERINGAFFTFLKWVWNFKSQYSKRIEYLLDDYKDSKEIYVCKSQQQIDDLVELLSKKFKNLDFFL